MNLFNKLTAGFTAAALVVTTLVPVLAATDTDYTEDSAFPYGATVWAINNEVTSNPTVSAAAPFANINREQFAAIAVRGFDAIGVDLIADDSLNCEYEDLSSASNGLQDFVTEACQKNLFQDADDASKGNFNAKAGVSEAVVAMVFCKALYGADECTADAGATRYSKANEVLVDEGVMMSPKSDAKMATRGVVFQMFKNVSEMDIVIVDDNGTGTLPDTTGTNLPGTTGDVVEVKAGNLNVSKDPMSSTETATPKTASAVSFLTFNVQAGSSDVTVKEINVKRNGASSASDTPNVYLYKGNARITDGKSVSSTTNLVRFTNLNMVVKANSSEIFTVRADVAGIASRTIAFSIESDGIVSTALTTNGLPVVGNTKTLADVSAGTVEVDARTVANTEVSVGGEAEIAKFNVKVNSIEAAKLRAINLTLAGNVSKSNLTNLKLLDAAGNTVATASTIGRIGSNDGVAFVLTNPINVDKGGDMTFSVRATVAGGRNGDTAGFYLSNQSDVLIDGMTYNTNLELISASDLLNTTDSPTAPISSTNATLKVIGSTSKYVTLKAGKLTFSLVGPATQNIAKGQNDVVLGVYTVNNQSGQPVDVRTLDFTLDTTNSAPLFTGGNPVFTNIRLVSYDNDTVAGSLSTVSDITTGASSQNLNFRDTFTLAMGTKKVAVVANIPTSLPSSFNGSYKVSLNTANSSFKSVDTNEFVTDVVPSAALSSNISKVIAGGLEVSYGNTPSGDTYVKGQQGAVVGSITLKATSALNVQVNTVSIVASGNLATTAAKAAYSTVSLYDGATLLSTAQSLDDNGKATFTAVGLSIPKSTTKTITIKANIGTTLTNNVTGAKFALDSTNNGLDVVQQPGGSSISTVMLTSAAPSFTIAVNGAIQITKNTTSSQSFNGGSNSTSLVSYGIKAVNVPYTVNKLAFAFSGNAGAIESVKLINGTNETMGSVQTTASGAIIRFDNIGLAIPANQVKTVSIAIKFPVVTISNSSVAGPFAVGFYNNTGDTTDDNEFVPTGVNGLDNIKDSDYNGGTSTGLQMTTLSTSFNAGFVSFGSTHSLLRAAPKVAVVSSSSDALVLEVKNETNDSITLSGIVVKAQNSARFVGGVYSGYVATTANGTDGSLAAAWSTGTVSLGAAVVNPGETKYIRLSLDNVSFAPNTSNAYFYVDADTSSTSTNLTWYVTGTPSTVYNGQGVYSSTLVGKTY